MLWCGRSSSSRGLYISLPLFTAKLIKMEACENSHRRVTCARSLISWGGRCWRLVWMRVGLCVSIYIGSPAYFSYLWTDIVRERGAVGQFIQFANAAIRLIDYYAIDMCIYIYIGINIVENARIWLDTAKDLYEITHHKVRYQPVSTIVTWSARIWRWFVINSTASPTRIRAHYTH